MSGGKLTETMRKAVDLARRGGLVYVRGGYWIAGDDLDAGADFRSTGDWVGTQTVGALSSRGVLTVDPDATGPVSMRRRVLTPDWKGPA